MNRSALCIQMLHILYGRVKPIQKMELAEMLETNPRNIIEFKKELEIAGYIIETTSGKYGGYVLKEEGIFPSLALKQEEINAMQEAATFLKKAPQFLYYPAFSKAMDKLNAKVKSQGIQKETIYLNGARKPLQAKENEMLQRITHAQQQHWRLSFLYRSAQAHEYSLRTIEPYELVVNEDGFYILAYDVSEHKKHDYKFFKISEERMKEVTCDQKRFAYDASFKVNEHTGKYTLMKEMHEVTIKIKGNKARLLLEKGVENILEQTWQKDELTLRFMMEGEWRLKQFLLSLGKDVYIVKPLALQKQIQAELKAAYQQYGV